jgi:phospholipid transport system transporter-binding protein
VSHRGDAVFLEADGGARWRCAGALTFANAAHAVAASAALALPHAGVVACDELGHVDSAAVAVLLAVKRRALKEGKALRFEGVPPPLQALATVYGVDRVLAD